MSENEEIKKMSGYNVVGDLFEAADSTKGKVKKEAVDDEESPVEDDDPEGEKTEVADTESIKSWIKDIFDEAIEGMDLDDGQTKADVEDLFYLSLLYKIGITDISPETTEDLLAYIADVATGGIVDDEVDIPDEDFDIDDMGMDDFDIDDLEGDFEEIDDLDDEDDLEDLDLESILNPPRRKKDSLSASDKAVESLLNKIMKSEDF